MANETLSSLKDEIESMVRDEARELFEGAYPEDRIHEMADGTVPIYNADLADVLASDPDVAYMDDPGLAEGCDDLYRRIAISIYEKLCNHAHSYWSDLKEEIEEALEEIETVDFDELAALENPTLETLESEEEITEEHDARIARRDIDDEDLDEDEIDIIESARDRLVDAYRESAKTLYWDDL